MTNPEIGHLLSIVILVVFFFVMLTSCSENKFHTKMAETLGGFTPMIIFYWVAFFVLEYIAACIGCNKILLM